MNNCMEFDVSNFLSPASLSLYPARLSLWVNGNQYFMPKTSYLKS